MSVTPMTAPGLPGPITPPADAAPRVFNGTLAASGFIGLAMGAMLGGAALGAVRTQDLASSPPPPVEYRVGAIPPMLALPESADEGAPDDDTDDDDDDLYAPPATASAGRPRAARGPSRNALDSAFYRVAPGPVTGYREGRAFTCTVTLVDGKPVEVHTATAFERMRSAASRVGLALRVMSGFRTMEHQRALYAAFRAGRGNLAALPGHSNHQSGHALDLNVTAPGVLRWLEQHAREYGFRRTVPTETWHWEHW